MKIYTIVLTDDLFEVEEAHCMTVMEPPTYHIYNGERWIASCPDLETAGEIMKAMKESQLVIDETIATVLVGPPPYYMTATFNAAGQQIPRFQGQWKDKREAIREHFTGTIEFLGGSEPE